MTRAAFQKLQEQQLSTTKQRMAFDIPGLFRLKETFATIDDSALERSTTKMGNIKLIKQDGDGDAEDALNILKAPTHAKACRFVLEEAGANIDESALPSVLDVSENFSNTKEILGDDSFTPPCSKEQGLYLRRNRNLFTSGEDNLVLRGVNLYGEKQWILIADRYLPDRSQNIVSQRYAKICVMLYKAHGIYIDDKGNLATPPKLESVDDIDEDKMKEWGLKLVDPPAVLNVHRWSLDEDLTLLKAVPIMGNM